MIAWARRLATLVWLQASVASSATPDADVLIRKLARDPPATIAFAEARFSALLKEPVIVTGQLAHLGAGSFDRRVTAPYPELTEIRGLSVRVEREGEPPRTFALKRAPELGGLLTSLVALLSGDAAAVAREFSVVASGDEGAWALELAPLDGAKRRRLQQILVSGADDELECFAVLTSDGAASVMLLGEDAADAMATNPTLETLLRQCRAE
jgi:Outer membrane lipoprotein carrier protein LolA-like